MKTLKPTRLLKHAFLAVCGIITAAVTAFADPACVLPTALQQATFNPAISIEAPPGVNGIVANPNGSPASFIKTTFINIPSGFSVTNDTPYLGWCVDAVGDLVPADFNPAVIYKPVLFSSCDPMALQAAGLPTANWDKVNYIINQKTLWVTLGYNVSEIQAAIWRFIGYDATEEAKMLNGTYGFGFPDGSLADVNGLVAITNANGTNFMPGPGQVTAVVLSLPGQGNPNGQLNFIEVLCPTCTGKIGDFIWFDGHQNTPDCNGIQDAADANRGLANIKVLLCDGVSGALIASTTTDSTGHYYFMGLCVGNYRVKVDASTLPPGYVPVTPLVGGDPSKDSNGALDGSGALVTLANNNTEILTIDFGYCSLCTGKIGDYVWIDSNNNGCQDANEMGIEGVKVDLYQGVCGQPGTLVASKFTDSTGHYVFEGLCAGDYQVVFNTPGGFAPTLYQSCVINGIPRPDLDSDCGTGPVCVNLPTDSSVNLTIDCGYICIGQIGNFVWHDGVQGSPSCNGIQDPTDLASGGIAGVKVLLYDGAMTTLLQEQFTTLSGAYLFTGLCPGLTYKVVVDPATLPPGYVPTASNAGGDPTKDSNGSPAMVTLTNAVPQNLTIDFGYCSTNQQPGLQLVKTVDKLTINAGEPVVYTYTVTNTGGTTLTNVTIVDDNATPGYLADDFTVVSGLTLAPGQFQSYSLSKYPPLLQCATIDNAPIVVGLLITEVLPNGDIKATYRQSLNLVDNTYGINASPDWGGHTFSNFTGSDSAEFIFTNKLASTVLDFEVDYISSNAAFPSGFGTLGVAGGDGGMLSGLASNVVSSTTTITTNLNQSPAFYGFTVNSPAFPVPAAWDLVDGYTVVVKAGSFGASGFGGVAIGLVHNSPPKIGSNAVNPEPCDSDAVNKATATATSGSLTVTATGTATVHIKGIPTGGGGTQAFTTYKQDDKGYGKSGTAASSLLATNFNTLYPGGLKIGGATNNIILTSAAAVNTLLPTSGSSKVLVGSLTNPATTTKGEIVGQMVALTINLDLSNASITTLGLANLKLKSGKLAGYTVAQVLLLGNSVLNGGALPAGVSLDDIKSAAKTINENYEKGTTDKGNLLP